MITIRPHKLLFWNRNNSQVTRFFQLTNG